ncbi:MAG TPA: type II toxin-antitoxin system HicB family antitoxin [Anaerolineae bacterium]|nr:type II toxin-antitoxin system HicB family antitoxin [Anaerolineae bacterium]HNU05795.1 type II toxin-antitoxin system HicB family antitoxin [Anaerolineae bacterium]
MNRIVVTRVEIFREDDTYVALCPDLDVSSFGDTPEQAKLSLHEALEGFLETCEALGTLEQVLEEAGFARRNGSWLARQPITAELLPIG